MNNCINLSITEHCQPKDERHSFLDANKQIYSKSKKVKKSTQVETGKTPLDIQSLISYTQKLYTVVYSSILTPLTADERDVFVEYISQKLGLLEMNRYQFTAMLVIQDRIFTKIGEKGLSQWGVILEILEISMLAAYKMSNDIVYRNGFLSRSLKIKDMKKLEIFYYELINYNLDVKDYEIEEYDYYFQANL